MNKEFEADCIRHGRLYCLLVVVVGCYDDRVLLSCLCSFLPHILSASNQAYVCVGNKGASGSFCLQHICWDWNVSMNKCPTPHLTQAHVLWPVTKSINSWVSCWSMSSFCKSKNIGCYLWDQSLPTYLPTKTLLYMDVVNWQRGSFSSHWHHADGL